MNKEEISMSEFMPMFVKFATDMQQQMSALQEQMNNIQKQINNLAQKVDDLRQDMNQRFDDVYQRLDYHETWLNRIEKNMATKTQLNSLLGVLNRKDVISKFEVSHIQTV